MIQIAPQMRILMAVEAVDFRNGIDGLVRVCKQTLQADAFSGCLFVFCNRRKTAIKILAYDGNGFWLCQKRLSTGRFLMRGMLAKAQARPVAYKASRPNPPFVRLNETPTPCRPPGHNLAA